MAGSHKIKGLKMDPTSKTFTTELDGQPRVLWFNANTYRAFEDKTGIFFMDWFVKLHTASYHLVAEALVRARENAKREGIKLTDEEIQKILERDIDPSPVLRSVSIGHFQALVWAACHEYDANDEPVRKISYGRMGMILDHGEFKRLFGPIVKVLFENIKPDLPAKKEAPAADGEPRQEERPTSPTRAKKPNAGGSNFGPSQEEVLASVRKKSGS
jgi:hypothetical protein